MVRLSFSRTRNSSKFLAAQLHPIHCVAQGLTNMRASIRTPLLNSQGSDPKTWIICLHLADYVIVAHTTTEMPATSRKREKEDKERGEEKDVERDDIFCALRQISAAPEGFLTALATTKAAAAQQRPRAPQLRLQALCVAPAKRKAAASPCTAAPQEDLSIAPSTREKSRGLFVLRLPGEQQPGRFFRCACQEKNHPMHLGGDHALQLPIQSLSTALATRKPAAPSGRKGSQKAFVHCNGHDKGTAQRRPHESSSSRRFCACHARGNQETVFTVAATSKRAAAQ